MNKEGQMLVDGENVSWIRYEDKNRDEYFVYSRRGYPPLVSRLRYSPETIKQMYETDKICKLK